MLSAVENSNEEYMKNSIYNAISIDVEDYFQVAALAKSINVSEWDRIPSRVEANTHKILDLFDKHNVKATHFILGWIAERYPELVKEIANRGHEVASHGFSHQLIYTQGQETFRQETIKSKELLEDITGEKVIGYRAASYSITKRSLWALDILAELGFKYDSSIFPILHDRYGIYGSPEEPHVLQTPKGHRLVEYPLSTYKILGQTLPIAGGGYFRLYPYWLSRYFYRKLNKNSKSFVFYLHPWEVDPEQPKVEVSRFSKFRHYNNLEQCENRLAALLSEFNFTTIVEKLDGLNLFSREQNVKISYENL